MASKSKNTNKRSRRKNSKKTQKQKIISIIITVLILIVAALVTYFQKDKIFPPAQLMVEDVSALYPTLSDKDVKKFEMTFFDVGQGDCMVGRFPNGETFVVDAGSDGQRNLSEEHYTQDKKGQGLNSFLKEKRFERIDHMLLTHPDLDHVGYLDDLIIEYDVKNFYLPSVEVDYIDSGGHPKKLSLSELGYNKLPKVKKYKSEAYYEFLLEVKKERENDGANVYVLDFEYRDYYKQHIIGVEEDEKVILDIYTPTKENIDKNINNASPIIIAEYGGIKICVTGDAEKENELFFIEQAKKLNKSYDIDILKLGHHGSGTSSHKKFLEFLDPEVGVISVGPEGKYKHPTKKTRETVAKYKDIKKDDDFDGFAFIFATNEGITAKKGTALSCNNIEIIIGSTGGVSIKKENPKGGNLIYKYKDEFKVKYKRATAMLIRPKEYGYMVA